MIVVATYGATGIKREYRGLRQIEVNKLISRISEYQDTVGEVDVKIEVKEDEYGQRERGKVSRHD